MLCTAPGGMTHKMGLRKDVNISSIADDLHLKKWRGKPGKRADNEAIAGAALYMLPALHGTADMGTKRLEIYYHQTNIGLSLNYYYNTYYVDHFRRGRRGSGCKSYIRGKI